jgi:CHAT domain-containing protein
MELDADLVVLDACHTARGQINSEGVVGLARAFQIAGASSVVTALWAIPDGATEYFMEQFYDNFRRGQVDNRLLTLFVQPK